MTQKNYNYIIAGYRAVCTEIGQHECQGIYLEGSETTLDKIIENHEHDMVKQRLFSRIEEETNEDELCEVISCETERHQSIHCIYHKTKKEKIIETVDDFPEPFDNLVVMIMEHQTRKHLKGKTKLRTPAQKQVAEQGATDQTMEWLEKLKQELETDE